MVCSFNTGAKIKDCNEDCRFFSTCTRNPHRKDMKEGQKNGRKKDVYQQNNRQ